MALWKKESNITDALYVDLFADKLLTSSFNEWNRKLKTADWKNELFNIEFAPGKNNQTSKFFRTTGDEYFKDSDWINAMEFYSQSLRFAELKTNNVSYAYANRATCFLKLKRYNECLRDIQLAKQANYPHKPKLMRLKTKCEQLMHGIHEITKKEDTIDCKLSFDPNEKFPCMADVLEVQTNEVFGRHVVASRDIDVGRIVLMEKNFLSLGCAPDRVQCYNCTKDEANFLACPKCTDVMFCSEECRSQNKVHQKFCGATINRMPRDVRFVAESLLLGIVEFSSANEMMTFVEETLNKRGKHNPDPINGSRAEYGHFLGLKPNKRMIDFHHVYKVFTGLLDNPTVKSMFNTEHSKRFLMHLCAEHWSIIKNNSFNVSVTGSTALQKLGIAMSWFNHACAPNLFNRAVADTDFFVTIRPIKKGEQLFISYFIDRTATTIMCQSLLLHQFDFLCKCDKCEPRCQMEDRKMMRADPKFTFLEMVSKENNKLFVMNQRKVMEGCVEFLQKYGHMPWSQEMDLVLELYTDHLFESFPKSL